MRSVLLLLLIACGDKRQAEPVAPGSAAVVVPTPAPDAAVEPPSRIALRAGTRPPVKTTLTRDSLTRLSALDIDGLTRRVRKLDDAFLDLEYVLASPPIAVGVTIQPCLGCLPMKLDLWKAEADALRVTIPPDLRDRSDGVTFEVTPAVLGGAPAIATYQLATVPKQFDQAVVVYFNDGVNQLRVIARSSIENSVERRELEQLALAVADRCATTW